MEQAKRWYEARGLPFNLLPDDVRATSDGKTSQLAENLPGSQKTQGLRLKKNKIKIAGLSDIGSRRVASSGEISQSTMETHQGEKGKEPLSSKNKEKIAALQALMEKAKADPEARERVRQLLENRQQKEQESSLPRRELDAPPDTTSVIFVHGLNGPSPGGSNAGHDCNQYWGDAMNFLSSQGLGDLRTIQFYNGDINCDNGNEMTYSSNLHDPLYTSLCTNYPAGSSEGTDGTNDESLYRVSCLFSQYLYYNFGQFGRNVVLVGHSMGGIIIRETLYQMQENAGQSPFPTAIGQVTDAITFNTPHEGIDPIGVLACSGCTQGVEMNGVSGLMSELKIFGQNPQTSGGFTNWTVIGSECDGYVGPINAIDMHASHVVVYATGSPDISCYDHNNAIHDSSTSQDAYQYYCDTSDPDNFPCGINYHPSPASGDKWVSTESGPRGLSALYDAITGNLP